MKEAKLTEADVGLSVDLLHAILNGISIEEHFYNTAMQLGKKEFLLMAKEVRKIRGKMLVDFLDIVFKEVGGFEKVKESGEVYCACKHILAKMERIMEVTNRLVYQGKIEKAMEYLTFFAYYWDLIFRRLRYVLAGKEARLGKTKKAVRKKRV